MHYLLDKCVSKIFTGIFLLHNSFFGPLENCLALTGKRVLVIPQAGVGDQILSTAAYKQLSETMEVHLLVREQHFPLVQSLLKGSSITLHGWNEGSTGMAAVFSERAKFRRLAKRHGLRILSLSDLQLRISRFGRPDINPIGHVYRILGLDLKSYNKEFYFGSLISREASPPLQEANVQKYALVDHFPGTPREIPSQTLDLITSRGLEIILAPKDVPFWELNSLIYGASELHLVNSSLLCWSLVLNPDIPSKNIYISQPDFLLGHTLYDLSWVEWNISTLQSFGNTSPTLLDRNSELMKARNSSRTKSRRFVNFLLYGSEQMDQSSIPSRA